MSSTAKYQRHVDGLRAVAVLSVVFYHFGQPAFGGGFVGVDVFFVISGYLISGLIIGELRDTGHFNFKRFYIRRMRRLFPAMAVTFTATAVVAATLFSPERFQALGQSLVAAVFSVSNILFWSESGYFDADAHLKPLLHTWSLGVEEQFYLLWPALLWLGTRKSGRRGQFYLLLLVGLGSFALNHLWVTGSFDSKYDATIFYLTPFRMFELVIGALAIFIAPHFPRQRWMSELCMVLGLALITYAVSQYSNDIVFPYLYALPPCLGALLVILAGESPLAGRLLTNRAAVGVGLISYSLYLVHWPLLVLYSYYTFESPGQLEYAGLFGCSIALAIAMYLLVEKPLRRNAPTRHNPAPQQGFVLACSAAMLGLALAGLVIHLSQGRTWHNGNALSAEAVAAGKARRFGEVRAACNLLRLEQPRYCRMNSSHQVLIIGNSHEADGYNIFNALYGDRPDVNLIAFGNLSGCQASMGDTGPVSGIGASHCAERVARLGDSSFISRLDAVVYSANRPFDSNKHTYWRILQHLQALNPDINIVVLGGFLNTRHECAELYNRFGSYNACRDPHYLSYNPFADGNSGVPPSGMGPDLLLIDKTLLLCTGDTVETCAIEANGEPAFYDKHHLSLGYARMLAGRVAKKYGEALVQAGLPPPQQ